MKVLNTEDVWTNHLRTLWLKCKLAFRGVLMWCFGVNFFFFAKDHFQMHFWAYFWDFYSQFVFGKRFQGHLWRRFWVDVLSGSLWGNFGEHFWVAGFFFGAILFLSELFLGRNWSSFLDVMFRCHSGVFSESIWGQIFFFFWGGVLLVWFSWTLFFGAFLGGIFSGT